jgi:hypothetical protein
MKKIIALLFAMSLLLSLSFNTHAVAPLTNAPPTKIGISWNPSVDAVTNPPDGIQVTGYKIYIGLSSRSYNQVIDVQNVTNYTITNLVVGTKYYFAVTAYGFINPGDTNLSNQLESDYSDELPWTMPAKPAAPINLRIQLSQVQAKWREVVAYTRRTWLTKPLVG